LIETFAKRTGPLTTAASWAAYGWISNFSFYYAHPHEHDRGSHWWCTNDTEAYQRLRMLRSHGMVRECDDAGLRAAYQGEHPQLKPDFIFVTRLQRAQHRRSAASWGAAQLGAWTQNVRRRNRQPHRSWSGSMRASTAPISS